MKKYLVSIAIATYNRQKFAEVVAKQVYNISPLIQVVISDNSELDDLKESLSDIIDNDRVKYIYTKKKISVVENYNLAASNSDGEYFCSIGDDDIVLDSIIDIANWMKKNHIDAVRTSRLSTYNWPAEGDTISNGLLALGPFLGKIKKINPFKGVIDALNKGCQSYMKSDMCGTYHEIVSKKLMDEAYSKCGYYYSGFSPDIYSATVCSLVSNIKAYKIDFPISIPGMCPASATFRAKKKSATSSVEEAIAKYGKPGYKWDKRVPYYYMPQTTWAVTMLNAIVDMGREDLIQQYFNKKYLVNSCCNYNCGVHKSELYQYLTVEEKKLIDKNIDTSMTETDTSVKTRVLRKFMTLYHLILGDKIRRTGVKDSIEAASLANRFLKRKIMKQRLDKIVLGDGKNDL